VSLNDYRIQLALYNSLSQDGAGPAAPAHEHQDGSFFAHSNMHLDPRAGGYEAIRLNQVATQHNSHNMESNYELGASSHQLHGPGRPLRVRNQVEIYGRHVPPADEEQYDSQNDHRQRFLTLGSELWLEVKQKIVEYNLNLAEDCK
jgi:hypothetical protein